MAWPGNFNWNMHNTGAGVDRAPPTASGQPPVTSPEFWQRWVQSRGWEDWNQDPWGPGPHGRHGHGHGHGHGDGGFGRRGRGHGPRGGPGGRHGRRGSDAHTPDASDNEAFPPEYITDEEVAAAVAEGEKANEQKDKDKDMDEAEAEMDVDVDSPGTMARDTPAADDPPEEVPDEANGRRHRGGCGHRGRRGRGGFGGFGHHHHHRRGSRHHGPPPPPFFGGFFGGPHGPAPPFPPFLQGLFGPGPHGPGPHGHPHHPPPPPPPPPHHGGPQGPHAPRDGPGAAGPPPEFGPWAAALAGHPFAQRMREFLERAQQGNNNNSNTARGPDDMADDDSSFTPPVDLFEQPDRWVLHFALPGARKEDVGVNWDADRSVLAVSGVVHRPGDEDFIRGLVSGERSVGLFSREVGLPPAGQDSKGDSKEEVNAEGIAAKMEDGVLVVTVPKVERGWTEVRKVDIA